LIRVRFTETRIFPACRKQSKEFKEIKAMPAAEKRICAGRGAVVLLTVVGLMLWTGCTQKKTEDPYLVRVKSQSLTCAEFKQAVATAIIEAFGGDRDIDLETLNDLRMRVMKQVSEEMMIAAYAADHDIKITEEELAQAVAAIKADYPDDTFEETLLENAVSFQFWRKQLATRLLIDKVIAKELVNPVQISAEDITGYYQANYPQGLPAEENEEDINRRIVTHLRRQKAEVSYHRWIEGLRQAYPTEVDSKSWKEMMSEEYSAP
jgi:hypothetical protein